MMHSKPVRVLLTEMNSMALGKSIELSLVYSKTKESGCIAESDTAEAGQTDKTEEEIDQCRHQSSHHSYTIASSPASPLDRQTCAL